MSNHPTPVITVKVPRSLRASLDAAVDALDTDKAKFIRAAIREKLARMRVALPA